MKRKRFVFPFDLDTFLTWLYVISTMLSGLVLVVLSILSSIKE